MKHRLVISVIILCLCGAAAALDPDARLQSFEKHRQLQQASYFRHLEWRAIGPYFMGGRVNDIEAYERDPFTIIIATASGGLWRTTNNATTWEPLFDHQSSISMGDVAVSQTDRDLIWVGTGEENSLRSAYAGTGVFKSVDGGQTWQHMGLADTHHIGQVLIHPKDNDIVYVAALGHQYTDNEERGVFKTTDGGQTWAKVLFVSPKTGAIDLVMHPRKPDVLLAAVWQKDRKAWNMTESGPESGIYKTENGGKTWQRVTEGLPAGDVVGRIGLDYYRADPDIVYAVVDNQTPKPEEKKEETESSGITLDQLKAMTAEEFLALDDAVVELFFKENNVPSQFSVQMVKGMVRSGRVNPEMMAKMMAQMQDPMFNTNIHGAEVYRSDDGGETWRKTHDDFLANEIFFTYGYFFGQIRVAPDNDQVVYLLGVPLMKSTDGGRTFTNISTGSDYMVGRGVHPDMHALWIDPRYPHRLILGNDGGVDISYDAGETWQSVANLPLAQCYTLHLDMAEPYHVYTGLQDNGVNRGPSNFRFGDRLNIWRMLIGGDGAFVDSEPGNPDVVYAASQFGAINRLDLAADQTKSIQPESGDEKNEYRFNWLAPFMISRHNPYTLYMGANKLLMSVNRGDDWLEISDDLTKKQNIKGDVPYATITALDESPFSPRVLYAGTDDGNVWVTRDGGGQWTAIHEGLPVKWVTRLVASQHKAERVYITLTGYRDDDFRTYVYASEDYGKTWTDIQGNLPAEPVNVIREDPVNENVLYLGTDLTAWVSLDRGQSWHSLRGDLPTNAVYDLRVQPRAKELVIATHGRGVFIADVSLIQQLTAEVMAADIHLFAPPPVVAAGPYRRSQAVVPFWLTSAGEAVITLADADGNVVHEATIEGTAGLNRWAWDMVLDAEKETRLEPGEYAVTVTVAAGTAEGVLKVE